MITVTTQAEQYLKRLIDQYDEPDMGLRLSVLQAGTPQARCDLQFCAASEAGDADERIRCDGFELYVAEDSTRWLESAEIDFERDGPEGQLAIRAPGIKGQAPAEDSPLAERVEWLLNTEINPGLASHGGRVALERITEENAVVLRFGGGCHGCGMVDMTLKNGIERVLRDKCPDVSGIIDATDHETGENPYYR